MRSCDFSWKMLDSTMSPSLSGAWIVSYSRLSGGALELRHEWELSQDDLALIYVGRIAPEKNLAVAVEAYRAIRRSNDRIKFVLVGDGPLRRSLQKENPDLIFAGMRIGEELGKYYASADVFLFPSETETFGNVTLEAMASGLVCSRLQLCLRQTPCNTWRDRHPGANLQTRPPLSARPAR